MKKLIFFIVISFRILSATIIVFIFMLWVLILHIVKQFKILK